MRLTPLDIRKQEFTRALRGFDAEEVVAFLQMLSGQWADLLDETRRKDDKIRELESKMAHYEKVEEALQDALQTARETSKNALQNAEEKARLIVSTAEQRAEEITREAESDRHQIKRETAKLSGRRSEVVARLKAFLMSELEILARYEGDDPIGFIKLLPAEEQQARQTKSEPRRPSTGSKGSAPSFRGHDKGGSKGIEQGEGTESRESDTENGASISHPETTTEGSEQIEIDDEPIAQNPSTGEDTSVDTHREPDDDFGHQSTAGDEGDVYDDRLPEEDGVRRAGWTNRPVLSQQPEQRKAHEEMEEDASANASDDMDTEDPLRQGSSDEIQKIRRILKDLD